MGLRLAGAFGGGMARTGGTCGAVTGALMVIGLIRSKVRRGETASRERCYTLAQKFMDAFRERNGSLLCRDLLGVDVGSPEGLAEVQRKDLFGTVCPQFVLDAAELLDGLVKEE